VFERPDELDALSRQGLRLLMHDSWPAFLRYLDRSEPDYAS